MQDSAARTAPYGRLDRLSAREGVRRLSEGKSGRFNRLLPGSPRRLSESVVNTCWVVKVDFNRSATAPAMPVCWIWMGAMPA